MSFDSPSALTALTPLDGRYRSKVTPLLPIFSEYGLIRARVRVEIEWLLALAAIIYILGVIVFTAQVNLPLNYYTESWDPQNLPADWAQVRTQWNNANAIRVGTSGAAFVLALAALVVRASRNAI